ncbi:MAG: Pr6Pr family membrane protein [Clostridia bacterium]|nr:Pr6Pr family membrane protein [Clostridia bacterium]
MEISLTRKIISYILKSIVIICAVTGTIMSASAGRDTFMGGGGVFMYFTIQSNIAIALVCLVGAFFLIKTTYIKNIWFVIKFVITISITLTGAVFCFVLAPTLGSFAWIPYNVLTHVVVPLSAIADFFVVGVYGNIKKISILYVTIPPLLYVVYAGIGYVAGWEFMPGVNYPYFFLNWGSPAGAFGFSSELPFMGCVWWIVALLMLLVGLGYLYLFIVDLMKKRLSKEN